MGQGLSLRSQEGDVEYVQVCTHVCTYMYVWVHRAHMYVYMCVRTCAHCMYVCIYVGFPGGSDSKESARNVGEPGVIPWSGRPPGEGKGYPCVCASYTRACVRVCSDCAYMYACVCGVCTECVRGVCAVTVCKHVGVRVCVQLCTVCAHLYMCAPCEHTRARAWALPVPQRLLDAAVAALRPLMDPNLQVLKGARGVTASPTIPLPSVLPGLRPVLRTQCVNLQCLTCMDSAPKSETEEVESQEGIPHVTLCPARSVHVWMTC